MGKCLTLLKEAYKEGAAVLQAMGYNIIATFDLELPVAEPKLEEADNMMKICGAIVNSGIAVDAWKRRNTEI